MNIGIPKEVKVREGRVVLIPQAAAELVKAGHDVFIQSGAGVASGYTDESYQAHGVQVAATAQLLYDRAEMIVKVKEPQPEEIALLQAHHLLFCYLHLAAEPQLMQALLDKGLTAVGFETVSEMGQLPLLAPMSDIAGKVAIQVGTHLLHMPQGGKGVLLGGIAATERGRVVVLGGGVAGGSAARLAASMGAEVTVFDRNRIKMEQLRSFMPNITALYPYEAAIAVAVEQADLVVGAVLIPGAKAPHLVSRAMVQQMQSGSVIIDISVDQGGCIETTRPTTYDNPTFIDEDVVHFGVTNMPGAVPRTASQAISTAVLPYALRLTQPQWEKDPVLTTGINVSRGNVIHPALKVLDSTG